VLRQYRTGRTGKGLRSGRGRGFAEPCLCLFNEGARERSCARRGDPYFSHPIEVAGILTDLNLDGETIATAILHDTIEDTVATPEQIEGCSAQERRAAGRRRHQAVAHRGADRERAGRREFPQVPAGDVRRHPRAAGEARRPAAQHAHAPPSIPSEKRRRIARETMDIYAPLAERIGMYEFMNEMQTLAFRELEPDAYASITKRLDQLTPAAATRSRASAPASGLLLGSTASMADVTGREKRPYSIWRKMAGAPHQLRAIVGHHGVPRHRRRCRRLLSRWASSTGAGRWCRAGSRIIISTPKRNGYRSLHTTVIHNEKMRIEIQIRTTRDARPGRIWPRRALGLQGEGGGGGCARGPVDPGFATSSKSSTMPTAPRSFSNIRRLAMYQDRRSSASPRRAS
jgi:guanosine-3',5'-bis(diphosphate) 3'-pyrophosphohydrolase